MYLVDKVVQRENTKLSHEKKSMSKNITKWYWNNTYFKVEKYNSVVGIIEIRVTFISDINTLGHWGSKKVILPAFLNWFWSVPGISIMWR